MNQVNQISDCDLWTDGNTVKDANGNVVFQIASNNSSESPSSGSSDDPQTPIVINSITHEDIEGLYTLESGIVTVLMFSLLAQLLTLGAVLVVVFVVAIRRV